MPEWPHPTVLWTIHYFLLSFKGKLSWACWEAKYTADMNYSSDCKGRIYKGSWETWKPAKLTSAGLVIWTSAGQEASTSSFEALWCFYQRVEHNTKRNLLVFINEIRDMVTVSRVIETNRNRKASLYWGDYFLLLEGKEVQCFDENLLVAKKWTASRFPQGPVKIFENKDGSKQLMSLAKASVKRKYKQKLIEPWMNHWIN